jgi:hypothetical protein
MLTNGSVGSLQAQDRAADAIRPRRDIDHGRLDGFQVSRRLGEVQQRLTGIIGGYLPGSAPLYGEEQRPSRLLWRPVGWQCVESVALEADLVAL